MTLLAIDFGGTRTRAACFSADLRVLTRRETPSLVHLPAEAVIERILQTAHAAVSESPAKLRAIGIAAPGPLNSKAGILRHAKTLPGWQNVPLATIVSEAFDGVPTVLQNDANLAALAEYELGAGRGADPMLYLTLSTGIGGGAILGGKLFTGWSGLAIEPGHMRFTLPDGNNYRLEELASGTAIGRMAREKLAYTTRGSSLRQGETVDGEAVGEAAKNGDLLALEVIEAAGTWLGFGLVNLLHLFSPQVIVVGGSVARLGDLILEPARRVITAYILDPAFYEADMLRLVQLGEDVCLIGAALYA